MTWQGKRVLVTGAGGFIGSHLTEALVAAGAKARAMVHYNALGSWGWLDEARLGGAEVVAGDVRDPGFVRDSMKDSDVVFHLAALISIPHSYAAPMSYVQTNILGTMNVLEAARTLGTPRVVHTSTSEVYGTALRVPIDEDHPLQGQSPYSASKIGADKMAESYHRSYGTPVVTVRPFNTFGPRQSARAVIPAIITQCLAGDVVRLGNLRPTRDLNYVSNTVQGFMRAAQTDALLGKAVNLGSGREIAIGDLARTIIQLAGRDVRIETDERRTRPEGSEVERLLADSRRAREAMGWAPEVSLEEGLKRTIDWMQSRLGRYRHESYVV